MQPAADVLIDMRRTKRVITALAPDLAPPDLESAYRIQDAVVAGMVPERAAIIGYKCACTSKIAQAALQIDRPVFGRLLSHTTSASGVVLDATGFTHRVIEAEVGFRLGKDVPAQSGPGGGAHTRQSIATFIDAVMPSIEVVDYRFESWAVGALHVAADNAIHGWWVHGDPVEEWREFDLAAMQVSVSRNGDLVTSGSGANVLGHPLSVMAWLADELPQFGKHLKAGDFVTTGVTTDVFEAEAGDNIVAEFAGLGAAEVSFG